MVGDNDDDSESDDLDKNIPIEFLMVNFLYVRCHLDVSLLDQYLNKKGGSLIKNLVKTYYNLFEKDNNKTGLYLIKKLIKKDEDAEKVVKNMSEFLTKIAKTNEIFVKFQGEEIKYYESYKYLAQTLIQNKDFTDLEAIQIYLDYRLNSNQLEQEPDQSAKTKIYFEFNLHLMHNPNKEILEFINFLEQNYYDNDFITAVKKMNVLCYVCLNNNTTNSNDQNDDDYSSNRLNSLIKQFEIYVKDTIFDFENKASY